MTKLIDVCEFIVDCPHSTAQDEGRGYPLIRTPNIGKGRFNLDGVHRVSESVYTKRNLRATPQDNDLIFAYQDETEEIRNYMLRQWRFVGTLSETFAHMK